MNTAYTAAAALLALVGGAAVIPRISVIGEFNSVVEEMLEPLYKTCQFYPFGLDGEDEASRINQGFTHYTYPDLAFYVKSRIDSYREGYLRQPVTSIASRGGKRDFAIAVWSWGEEIWTTFNNSCNPWRVVLRQQEFVSDQCADEANGFILPHRGLANAREGFRAVGIAVLWRPSYMSNALTHPFLRGRVSGLHAAVYTNIMYCRDMDPEFSVQDPATRTHRDFLKCLRPKVVAAYPESSGSLLLIPAQDAVASLTAPDGGLTVFDIRKELELDAEESGIHRADWKLIGLIKV